MSLETTLVKVEKSFIEEKYKIGSITLQDKLLLKNNEISSLHDRVESLLIEKRWKVVNSWYGKLFKLQNYNEKELKKIKYEELTFFGGTLRKEGLELTELLEQESRIKFDISRLKSIHNLIYSGTEIYLSSSDYNFLFQFN